MIYQVYILKCNDDTLYTGCTNNLKKRLKQHNHLTSGAYYTSLRRPVTLMHSETFKTLKEARQREAVIKRLSRSQKIALIDKHY